MYTYDVIGAIECEHLENFGQHGRKRYDFTAARADDTVAVQFIVPMCRYHSTDYYFTASQCQELHNRTDSSAVFSSQDSRQRACQLRRTWWCHCPYIDSWRMMPRLRSRTDG